jgi:hypothetical protein
MQKKGKKLVRIATKSLYDDLFYDTLMTFAEKAYGEVRQRWLRLEAIKITLNDSRIKQRCKRYIGIWKWASKRKREKRAINNFSKTLLNRSNDSIKGISKIIKPVFGAPITKKDVQRLEKIKKRQIQAKYFNLWKKTVAFRRQQAEERRNSFKISNRYEIPKMLQLREEQKKRLMEGNKFLFPNRKRLSSTEPECSGEKKFFTSTPYRGTVHDSFMIDVSPVIRTNSAASSNQDYQENGDPTEKLKEMSNSFEKMSQLLNQTKQRTLDIQSRYKDFFTDLKR